MPSITSAVNKHPANHDQIQAAAIALRRGELIGIPTETVYGLGADARNEQAIKKIFTLKNRPLDHPLIVHIASITQLQEWAIDISPNAYQLAAQFWPGPMTLILKRHPSVSTMISGGQATIGIRIPSHPVAQQLLTQFASGIAAPSANRFGHISPTRAAHVRAEFDQLQLPIILDGGDSEVGIESTIIDCSTPVIRILRPGKITRAQIEKVIGKIAENTPAPSPRVSGSLDSHYAPTTPALLLSRSELVARGKRLTADNLSFSVLAICSVPPMCQGIALANEPNSYAHELYAALRTLDDMQKDFILIEAPPKQSPWLAVQDRLQRAAKAQSAEHGQ